MSQNRITSTRSALMAVLLLGLTACGQKGPLYLPDQHSQDNTSTGEPQTSQAKQDKK